MYCNQCGEKIPENSKFCPACGAHLEYVQPNRTEQQPACIPTVEVPKGIVGMVYLGLGSLAWEQTEAFRKRMSVEYSSMDDLVSRGEAEIEQIFARMDAYFVECLRNVGIFSYQAPQVHQYTKQYVRHWRPVFEAAKDACAQINGKERDMRAYREMRKDGRGRIVGGGFGVSGAIQGMATAGAINMTTGLLHSFVNAVGNARSASKAADEKRGVFGSDQVRVDLPVSILVDCLSMTEGFAKLWDQLDKGKFPVYTMDAFLRACNIKTAIEDEQIPSGHVPQAIEEMLELYPVSEDLYFYAAAANPVKRNDYYAAAAEYGMDLHDKEDKLRAGAQRAAKKLVRSEIFLDTYNVLDADEAGTVEAMEDVFESSRDSDFLICSDHNLSKSRNLLVELRSCFMESESFGAAEIPILAVGPKSDGLLLTNKRLFLQDDLSKSKKVYPLDRVEQVETAYFEDRQYLLINGESRVRIMNLLDPEEIAEVIRFFIGYSPYIQCQDKLMEQDFLGPILAYTDMTVEQLEAAQKALDQDEPEPEPVRAIQAGTQYCFECGAPNDVGAVFCCECGAKLE